METDITYQHQEIVDSCKANLRDAQQALYKLYARAMFNTCLRIVDNEHDAEDILQDSFVSVFKNINQFNNQSSIGAWIKRIVVNNSINFLNRKKSIFFEIKDDVQYIEEDNNESSIIEITKIQKAITQLPDGYKQILILYLLEGYEHQEISQILNISVGTSKSQYHRAKNKLKEIIKKN